MTLDTHRISIVLPEPDVNLDRLLGSHREFSSREVSHAVGIPMFRARRYWRALGFANVPEGDAEFTSADIDALSTLVGLVRDHVLDEAQSVELARALGRATARLSVSHAEGMAKLLDASGVRGDERRSAAREITGRVLPELDKLLLYSWRRHLSIAMQRLQPHVSSVGPTVAAVGFADLVSFTRLSRQLSEQDLSLLVQRFESRVADLVTSLGGRVIKSLGDEVLFVADDPTVAADIAIDLAAMVRRRSHLPGVRIGLELGPVINHAGDVFGDTVNLASRLTAMAEPNHILVGPKLSGALTSSREYQLSQTPPVEVRGYGIIAPSRLSRSIEPSSD
jgi:adenylate cyclase